MEYTLTKFEIAMMQLFHLLDGSTTKSITEEPKWHDIQYLKKLALEECNCKKRGKK